MRTRKLWIWLVGAALVLGSTSVFTLPSPARGACGGSGDCDPDCTCDPRGNYYCGGCDWAKPCKWMWITETK
jgi:hypothetical protein